MMKSVKIAALKPVSAERYREKAKSVDQTKSEKKSEMVAMGKTWDCKSYKEERQNWNYKELNG